MFNFFMIVFEQSMIYLPITLGAYISFSLLKVPDLSLETSYLIGAFFGGTALQLMQGFPLSVVLVGAVVMSILGGILVGLTVSFMTCYADIPHLLSSIITFGLFQGIFLMYGHPYISLAKYRNVLMIIPSAQQYPELLTLIFINCVVCLFLLFFLRTQLGYSFVIFGCNPSFFHHFKISINYVFMHGIVLAHGLSGLAGFFFAQTNSLIEMNMGLGKALFCITVLILGKTLVGYMQNSILIPIIGVLFYFTMQQSLLKVGLNLKYFTMIQSLLVFIVLITLYKQNRAQHDLLGL